MSKQEQEIDILILAYYFPPSNSTASDRLFYWFKYLKDTTYKVKLITKDWGEIDQEKNDKNIIQVPVNPKAIHKIGNSVGIKKLYKQFSPILEPIFLLLGEKSLLLKAEELIVKNPNLTMITSSSPFSLFKIGYLLKIKYPSIKWIADYRDDWSSRELVNYKIPILAHLFINWIAYCENKWVSKANCFISVSDKVGSGISKVLKNKIPGFVIENGYDFLKAKVENNERSTLHFAYTGMVYEIQDFESNLERINSFAVNYPSLRTVVSFVSSNLNEKRKIKLKTLAKNIHIDFYDYMQRAELDQFNATVDVFIMSAYGDIKGIPSSKLYYFLSFQKPIFLYPSDDDIIDNVISECGLKINDLNEMYEAKLNHIPLVRKTDENKLFSYSREAGTEKLIKIIESI